MRELAVRRLGVVPYGEALAMQRALVEERKRSAIPDTLLLLQHPHVITLGVKGDGGRGHILAPAERLAALGVEVAETGRGGDVTYHGPGQLVAYPIIDLDPDRRDVHRYVRDLEEVMIRRVRCLRRHGRAHRRQDRHLATGARRGRRLARRAAGRRPVAREDRRHRRSNFEMGHEPRHRLECLDGP